MIITKLIGGLGNQLFQYSAGLSLSRKYDTDLIVDISEFNKYKLHSVAIDNFKISGKMLDEVELLKVARQSKIKILRLFNKNHISYYKELQFNYNKAFDSLKNNSYLIGYWQSEKYFLGIREVLLNEFSLAVSLSENDINILNIIQEKACTSLHVRRGDYVNNSVTNNVHGVCTISYYQKAIKFLKEKTEVKRIFVFSDDHQWAKENIKSDLELVFVNHNDASRNYADLWLMSKCDNNIIANSSFSWWGAWLNQNPDKIVIAPEHWFNDTKINTQDLIPETWVKL